MAGIGLHGPDRLVWQHTRWAHSPRAGRPRLHGCRWQADRCGATTVADQAPVGAAYLPSKVVEWHGGSENGRRGSVPRRRRCSVGRWRLVVGPVAPEEGEG
jgi:hypothetical protein